MSSRCSIDEKDLRILEILSKNSRIPYAEIARALNLSDVAILKRVKKLEQCGIITRYTIVVDPKKLGYSVVSITGIDVEPQRLFEVINSLKNKDCVKYLALTTGDHSIIATIWAKDSDELSRLLDEISKLPGVKRVCPSIVLEVFKQEFI